MFMRMMAGPVGAIGSELAQSPRIFLNIYPSRRPAFVRGLDLKSGTEWKGNCKSGKKPADIPAEPDNGYADDGWAGIGHWLVGSLGLQDCRLEYCAILVIH